MFFGHDIYFWITLLGAGIVKILMTKWTGTISTVTSFTVGLFLGVVFHDPVLSFFKLDPNTYSYVIVVLIVLTGENLARWVMKKSNNPSEYIINTIKDRMKGK